MLFEASEALFEPATLLWLAASVIAAGILLGSINRRRSSLTDSLRNYVDQTQQGREAVKHRSDESND